MEQLVLADQGVQGNGDVELTLSSRNKRNNGQDGLSVMKFAHSNVDPDLREADWLVLTGVDPARYSRISRSRQSDIGAAE
jgi:hypothetical protein